MPAGARTGQTAPRSPPTSLPILGRVIEAPAPGFLTVGQPAAQRVARHAARRGRQGRTILVHGPRGAGKAAFVDDLLALAFCTDDDPERRPCNACRGCRDARARRHPDLVVGSPEIWRESRGTGESIVAAARRWLLGAAGAPVVADRRIVLIERADDANEQTQNALLKALEEPSDRHAFVLVAEEPSRLLPTIRSRCQPLRIGPVPRDELVRLLMDHPGRTLPADLAETLATLSNGLPGLALRLSDEPAVLEWRKEIQRELLALLEVDRADRFAAVAHLLAESGRLEQPDRLPVGEDEGVRIAPSAQRAAAIRVVEVWIGLSRDLLVAAVGGAAHTPSAELAPDIAEVARRIGPAQLVAMVERLERIHDGLLENAAPRLSLEIGMLAWPRVER